MFEIHPPGYQIGAAGRRRQKSLATNKANRSRLLPGFKSSVMILIRCTKICKTKKLLIECPAAPSLQTGKRFPGLCMPCPGLQGNNSMMNPAALAAVLNGFPKARNLGSRSSVRICMFLGRIAYLEGNRLGGCSEDKHDNLKYKRVPEHKLKSTSCKAVKRHKNDALPVG